MQVSGLNWFHGIRMLLIVLVIKTGTQWISESDYLIKAIMPLALLGRKTLYLFLYHILFLNLGSALYWNNIWTQRIFVIAIMTLGPLTVQYLLPYVKKWITCNVCNEINFR